MEYERFRLFMKACIVTMATLWCVSWACIAICRADTVDELAYKYNSDVDALIHRMNETVEITGFNCRTVTGEVYNVMKRGQWADVKLIGLWGRETGHMFIAFKDRWGDDRLITIVNSKERLMLVNIKIDGSMAETFKKMYPTSKFYRIYRDNTYTRWETIIL